jgi:hypothetical protein
MAEGDAVTSALLSLASLGAFAAVVLSWLFRQTSAPLWLKVSGPTAAVIAACSLFFTGADLLGYPAPVSESALPDHAELLAFVPHDDAKLVDLWLIAPSPWGDAPRAYETELTQRMKATLRAAQEAMEHGGRVTLAHAKATGNSHYSDQLGIGDDDSRYVLEVQPALPAKE